MIDYLKTLVKERTSWDGVMLIAVCGAFILFGAVSYTHLTLPTNREV